MAIVKERELQEVITFLEKEIAEYEQWREKNLDDIGLPYKLLSSDLYFLLAKAKEDAGLPKKDIIAAYKHAIFSSKKGKAGRSVLTWLFENVPTEQYTSIVRTFIQNNAQEYVYVIKQLEASANWPAFKLFLDVVFSETEDPVASARSVEHGLSENSIWKKEYLEYTREYVFEKDYKVAEKYVAKESFKKAAEAYRNIMKRYGPGHHKSVLELKVCEYLFKGGEYQNAISELDQFIARNKATNANLAKEAILMKGRCYIQSGEIGKASNEFLTLTNEYPETKQTPEVSFFIGYCYMLDDRFEEATEAFNAVMQDYPESSYVSKVRTCLIRIENMAN